MDKAAIVFKKFFSRVADLAANTVALPANIRALAQKPTLFQTLGRKLGLVKNKEQLVKNIAKGLAIPAGVAIPIGIGTKVMMTDHSAKPEKM